MSWESDEQRGEVARALLGLLTRDTSDLWTENGPTDLAVQYLHAGGGPLSSGEALMLRLAFDVWNGEGKATLGELLSTFHESRLRLIGTLISDYATGEVESWLRLRRYGASE